MLHREDNLIEPVELPRRSFLRSSGLLSLAPFSAAFPLEADYRYHTVERGDTISELAEQYGTTITRLRQLNNLRGNTILIGQKLKISRTTSPAEGPVHRYHTVRRGDTLSGIAATHGTSVHRLMQLNGLHGDTIRIGQKLKVAGGGSRFLKPDLVRVSNLNRGMWKNIIAHHSAIRHGNAKVYGREHKRRGMVNGLAYHFVIGNGVDSGDGEIEIGPRWTRQIEGGHVKSRAYNLTSIGICLVGDFEKFKPTGNQITAFEELVSYLKYDLLHGKPRFYVHKDLEQTACPGRNFPVRTMHKQFG